MFKIRALLIILLNVLLSYHVFSFVMVVLWLLPRLLGKEMDSSRRGGFLFCGSGLDGLLDKEGPCGFGC